MGLLINSLWFNTSDEVDLQASIGLLEGYYGWCGKQSGESLGVIH